MQEKYKEVITKIYLNTPLKKITWDNFFTYFDVATQNSPDFFEILNEVQNKGIQIIDKIEYEETVNDLDKSTYIIVKANSFSEIVPTLRKYKDGDIFCDYLTGVKIKTIADALNIDQKEATKRIKKFSTYIDCPEIEIPLLGIYINYDIKPKEFSERLHIDTISAKYLFLKYATLPADKNKYYTVAEEFKERLVGIPLRTHNGN